MAASLKCYRSSPFFLFYIYIRPGTVPWRKTWDYTVWARLVFRYLPQISDPWLTMIRLRCRLNMVIVAVLMVVLVDVVVSDLVSDVVSDVVLMAVLVMVSEVV